MATTFPVCACPADSNLQLLAKANNGFSALFFIMSAGQFRGNTVNLGSCLCSESQILAAINGNVASFFTWFANSGGVPVDFTITTLAQLAAIPTTSLTPPVIKLWVLEADGSLQAWRLLAGTDATVAGSIQRPNDYDAGAPKVWYRASS